MAYKEQRSVTAGNRQADLTKIRADITKINPVIQSTMRNAVPENGISPGANEFTGKNTINPHKLTKLSNIISSNINAAIDLRIITPYIDKAELIWNTILFNPNGKQDQVLTYDTINSKVKNTKLHAELLQPWKEYFTNDYKIENDLRTMASDMLWNTGSYVLLNISRPSLDYLINGSEMKREGNEEFKLNATSIINKEFVKKDQGYVTRNLGKFVRDPNDKSSASVSGLEAILSNKPVYSGTEFNIFGGEEWRDDQGEYPINITITDNPAILFLQKLNAAERIKDVNSVVGAEGIDLFITEALNKKTPPKPKDPKNPEATTINLTEEEIRELGANMFPSRNPAHQSIQFLKTDDSLKVQTYGRGLTFHVPSEAVITVHRRGDRKKQSDIIILMGDNGEFLRTAADPEYYQGKKPTANNNGNNQAGSVNSLITNLRQVQDGKPCDFDMSEFTEMASSSIIKQYMSSVLSGKGDNISIKLDEETNKIFLSRIFKRQSVRCLYVPGECVTYMAFKYNNLGMGQSLTQAAKLHIARLAAYDVADALANISAAQPHSQLTVNINEKDPDPAHTIAVARSAFFESNPRVHDVLSVAQLSIPQVVDALRESSLTVKINAGDNVHMPAPDFDLARLDNSHYKTVDPSSRDEVLNKIANYFNLPRSWLDVVDGNENNFQIEALTEHQMIMNQGAAYQEMLAEFIVDFQRKHITVNAPVLNELVKVIVNNKSLWKPDSGEDLQGSDTDKVKIILNDFVSCIYCELPTPASTDNINKLKEKLDAIDALVKAWEDMSGYVVMLPGIATTLGLGEGEFSSDEIKAAVSASFRVAAFKRFNLPVPFDEIVNEGKGGGIASLVNSIVYQRTNIGEFLAKYTQEIAKGDRKLIKSHYKAISKALEDLEKVSPNTEGDDTPIDEIVNNEGEETFNDDVNNEEEDSENISDGDENIDDNEETPDEETPNEDGLDPTKNNPNENPFG